MKIQVPRWRLALFVIAIAAWVAAFGGCAAGDLSEALSGGKCDHGKCASGYVCNTLTNQCVPKGSFDGGSNDASGDADADPCASCKPNETCCTDVCADLDKSPAHCGSCDTPCPGTTCGGGTCTSTCALGHLDCNKNIADGCEVDAATDPANCGSCSAKCSVPAGGAAKCALGTCSLDCGTKTLCDVVCVDSAGDPSNCGGCAKQCPPVENGARACAAGKCSANCDTGFTLCGADGCTNAKTDPFNCGTCQNTCATGLVCDLGTCAASCSSGLTKCGASCVDLTADIAHCSACGSACPVPANGKAVCSASSCGIECDPGFDKCGSACVSLQNDPLNCGACDAKCPAPPNATATCAAGSCGYACQTGFVLCGSDCVDVKSDTQNCGACGTKCGADQYCVSGQCQAGCPPGTTPCSGVCVDTKSDPSNCGACAASCPGVPHGTPSCTDSQCGFDCSTGYLSCAGACISPTSDPDNCGSCGNQCTPPTGGSVTCEAGECKPQCPSGYTVCDDACVNTKTDVDHCGGCGNKCSTGLVCSNGACIPTCPSGTTDCGGQCVDTGSDIQNCGSCGHACSAANATASCNGTCSFACLSGFANCNTDWADGCEVGVNDDPLNCGTCGTVCPAPSGGSASCSNGQCQKSCPSGFTLCGNTCINTQTDPQHCGSCTTVCANGLVCQGGSCVANCAPPLTACGQTCANLTTDVNNCGTCGTVCPNRPNASRTCVDGKCGISCNSGYGDCDGSVGNGCELVVTNNPYNCGACGVQCSETGVSSVSCVDGKCKPFCELGKLDCAGNNDGCESDYSASACGSCGLVCPSGQSCDNDGVTPLPCRCTAKAQCIGAGGSSTTASCLGTGVCQCNAAVCAPGEVCGASGCSCNGGAACAQTVGSIACCPTPPPGDSGNCCTVHSTPNCTVPSISSCVCAADPYCCNYSWDSICVGEVTSLNCGSCFAGGCKDLSKDAQSCGACGRRCPTGFVCTSGQCVCDQAADCNAGSVGTCVGGVCSCNTLCGPGERCQIGGKCG